MQKPNSMLYSTNKEKFDYSDMKIVDIYESQ